MLLLLLLLLLLFSGKETRAEQPQVIVGDWPDGSANRKPLPTTLSNVSLRFRVVILLFFLFLFASIVS